MFATTAVLMILTSPVGEIVETTRSLELKLDVIEAFEHGPVILDVTFTNRGKTPVILKQLSQHGRAAVWVPKEWGVQARQAQCPFDDNLGSPVFPAETVLQRERLHLTYRSAFPAGAYRVLVVWEVTTTRGLRGPTGRGFPVPGDVPFQLSTTFPVTISPATPANRWALAARLEAEFAALPPPVTDKGLRDYHFDNLCEKVICTPHKELVPLAFRLLERYPQGWGRSAPGWLSNDGLAETIFQADPATAHRLFVDRLITSPPRMNPILAFWIWWEPVGKFTQISDRFFAVFKPEFLTQPEYWHLWNPMRDLGDLIAWSRDAAARRLPDVELRRLAAAKDPEVRRLVERYFGTRLESK